MIAYFLALCWSLCCCWWWCGGWVITIFILMSKSFLKCSCIWSLFSYLWIVLPIPVELNVHADKLATIGSNHLPSKPHIPFDPSVKIQVNFTSNTLTQNIPYFLWEKLLLQPLCQQYEDLFGWNDTEFNDIDWEIFQPV